MPGTRVLLGLTLVVGAVAVGGFVRRVGVGINVACGFTGALCPAIDCLGPLPIPLLLPLPLPLPLPLSWSGRTCIVGGCGAWSELLLGMLARVRVTGGVGDGTIAARVAGLILTLDSSVAAKVDGYEV